MELTKFLKEYLLNISNKIFNIRLGKMQAKKYKFFK